MATLGQRLVATTEVPKIADQIFCIAEVGSCVPLSNIRARSVGLRKLIEPIAAGRTPPPTGRSTLGPRSGRFHSGPPFVPARVLLPDQRERIVPVSRGARTCDCHLAGARFGSRSRT